MNTRLFKFFIAMTLAVMVCNIALASVLRLILGMANTPSVVRYVDRGCLAAMTACVIAGSVSMLWTIPTLVRAARHDGLVCIKCAYNRRHSDAEKCPECGDDTSLAECQSKWRRVLRKTLQGRLAQFMAR